METLRYVVLANGLLVVVSLAFYVLLRRETFFGANRLALWLGLTASLVLPLLELPDWRPQPVRAVMQRTARVIVPKVLPGPPALQPEVTITFPNGRTYPAFSRRSIAAGWSWQQGVLGLYVAVLLALLIRFWVRLRSLLRLIRRSAQEPYDDFTLVRNGSVTSPFSFFGWVVLNPGHHAPDELEQILRHERVHVRAWHSADMIAAELVSIVFWFNPAAYLFRQLVHQTLEFSADRAVLAEGIDAKAYQYNLIKVSLSAGQSRITNHFSSSQLKFRIVMLNKPKSPRSTWLKYPVLCVAALLVATAFARPSAQTLKKFVPVPVAETITAVVSPEKKVNVAEPIYAPKALIKTDTVGQVSVQVGKPTADVPSVAASDSVYNALKPDSARTSPSRYMVYQGDYLYWIVTPKTALEDFTVMKHELAKYGGQLQLNEVKYDPLYAYIERVALSVVGPGGVQAKVNELNYTDKPIPTNAGYMIHNKKAVKDHQVWSSRLDGRFSKTFPLYQTAGEENFPDALRKVATDDEAAIAQFINSKKMEYLVLAGKRKYENLGGGDFRQFDKEEIKKQSRPNSSLSVKPDGSLSINEEPHIIKTFINNEPASNEDVRRLKIDQLYTVAIILGYDRATNKRTMTDYFLFYVNDDK